MAGLVNNVGQWRRDPFWQGFLLLVILITLFLAQPLFTHRALLAADLLFQLDPLWQPLVPPGWDAPANQALSDQTFEFYPWQHFIRAELAQGRLPLWNPYVYSGHPLLANAQSALFDPFNMVARLWPLAQSFVVIAFLRLLCAGTFMLLLALELRLSRAAAYLAMVVFTFALPQIVWLLYPKASVLVWLPALLLFSLRVMRTGKWRYVGALGLVMGAQVVGGHPETALFSVLLWVIFSSYWLWGVREPSRRNTIRRAILQLMLAGVLGLGAGAVQWAPTVEALLHSEVLAARSETSLTWQTIFLQWRDWLAALTMLLPNFFGNPRQHDYWYPYSNYTEQTLYVGILPLALALLVYFVRGTGRQVAFFAALAATTLALALRVPPLPLVAEVPLLSVTNVGRLRGVYMLAMAVMAGYGLDVVRQGMLQGDEGDGRSQWLLTRTVVALGVVAALVASGALALVTLFQADLVELGRVQAAAAQGNPFFFRTPEEYLTLAEVRVAQMIASFHPANWTMYLPLLFALAVVAVTILIQRTIQEPHLRARALAVVILGLTVGELWRFGLGYNPTIEAEQLYPTPPLVAELLRQDPPGAGPPYRVMGTGLALVPNVSMLFALEDIRGYDPIAPRRYMELISRVPGAVRVGHHLLFAGADAAFLDFLNVRYLFSSLTLGERWSPLHTSNGLTLYRNEAAMPRAFLVYRSQVAATPAASLAMTLAPEFDFRNAVVLEGEQTPTLQEQPARAPTVEISHHAPGEMTVEVVTARPGVLVVSEPYMPGWMARVDGNAVEMLIANHAFRAVSVPEGRHTVTFAYRPMSLNAGAWSSGVSVGMLLLLVVFGGAGFARANGSRADLPRADSPCK